MQDSSRKYFILVLPWLIWAIAAGFYCHQFFLRVSIGSLSGELAHSFHFNAVTLSNVTATFFYAYFLIGAPAGVLIDHFGAKKILILATSFCALGCFLFSAATNIILLEISRFVIGAGAAFSGILSMSLARTWFSKNSFSIVNSLSVTVGTIGAVFGGIPLVELGNYLGWRKTMLFAGVICIILAIFSWIIVKDTPEKTPKTAKKLNWHDLFTKIKQVITNKQILLVTLFAGLSFLPIATFATLWGTPFIMAEYGIPKIVASDAITLIYVGFAVGCPLFGWLANRYQLRKILAIAMTIALVLILGILYLPNPPFSIMLILQFLLGVTLSSNCLAIVAIRRIATDNIAATAFSLPAMAMPLFGAIFLEFIGWLLEFEWSGHMVNNIEVYNTHNYHIALAIIPLSILLSIFTILAINPKKVN